MEKTIAEKRSSLSRYGKRLRVLENLRSEAMDTKTISSIIEVKTTSDSVLSTEQPTFIDGTEMSGQLSRPWFREMETLEKLGVAVGDVNNDGYSDIYTVGTINRLYVNNQDGTFTDFTYWEYSNRGTSVLADINGRGRGAAWGDYNNDGFLDLYVANYEVRDGGASRLFRNNGDWTFTDVAQSAGVSSDGLNSRIPTWGDFDGDGDLDLFVSLGAKNSPLVKFDDVPYEPQSSILYQNNGDGTFTNVTQTAGLYFEGDWVTGNWGDYDNDGYLDLHIVTGTPPYPYLLFHNEGDGTFINVTESAGVLDYGRGRGSAWGDWDGDGDLDLFVTNNGRENRLYQNNEDGTFVNVASSLGLTEATDSRSASWMDYDADGDLDLFIASQNALNNKLYRNEGNATFTEVADSEGLNDITGEILGSAWGDFDRDGDLELFTLRPNSFDRVFQNLSDPVEPTSLFLRILDSEGHFTRQGAQVRLYEAGTQNLVALRMVEGANSYLGQSLYDAYFGGIDPNELYDIEVTFPGGLVYDKNLNTSLQNINPQEFNGLFEIRQPQMILETTEDNEQFIGGGSSDILTENSRDDLYYYDDVFEVSDIITDFNEDDGIDVSDVLISLGFTERVPLSDGIVGYQDVYGLGTAVTINEQPFVLSQKTPFNGHY